MFKTKTTSRSKGRKLLVVLGVLLVLGAALITLEKTGITDFYSRGDAGTQDDMNDINYDPPTEEEQSSGDNQKDQIIQEQEEKSKASTQGISANVIITDAGQYDGVVEVRAFIPDHYQDGTCTVTFIKGNLRVSKDTPAYRDVSTTICTNPLFERSEFAEAGDWKVTVSYVSSDATGVSETKNVTIN